MKMIRPERNEVGTSSIVFVLYARTIKKKKKLSQVVSPEKRFHDRKNPRRDLFFFPEIFTVSENLNLSGGRKRGVG